MPLKFLLEEQEDQPEVTPVVASLDVDDDSGDLTLLIDGWFVFTVRSDGTAFRVSGLPDNIGLQTDKHERIQLVEN